MSGPGMGGPQVGHGGAPQHPGWINAVIFGGIGVIIVLVAGIGVVLMTTDGGSDDDPDAGGQTAAGGDTTVATSAEGDGADTGDLTEGTTGTDGADAGTGETAADRGVAADDHVYLEDLEPGTCVLAPDTEELVRIGTVDCGDWYDYEVYHVEPLEETLGAEWPGDDEVDSTSRTICEENFEAHVGLPEADSELQINYLTPIESSWEFRTDVTCMAGDPVEPTQGSLEGANR